MPANVLVSARAIVTAGFTKDVNVAANNHRRGIAAAERGQIATRDLAVLPHGARSNPVLLLNYCLRIHQCASRSHKRMYESPSAVKECVSNVYNKSKLLFGLLHCDSDAC